MRLAAPVPSSRGRGRLAAALMRGAQGANIGTRFLASEEAASNAWQAAILAAKSEDAIRFEVWAEIMPSASWDAYSTVPRVLPTPFI